MTTTADFNTENKVRDKENGEILVIVTKKFYPHTARTLFQITDGEREYWYRQERFLEDFEKVE